MKEHPILFSGPLVRAILSGKKTQTRRLMRSPRGGGWTPAGPIIRTAADLADPWFRWERKQSFAESEFLDVRCPYRKPGDRLWVRETWRPEPACSLPNGWALRTAPGDVEDDGAEVAVRYHADGAFRFAGEPTGEWQWPQALTPYRWGGKETRWMPSILMPRWASRISLEVTEVRVQRLRDITDEDACAEGVTPDCRCEGGCDTCSREGVDYFRDVWEALAPDGSKWANNPWVWAVGFKRVQG